MNPDPILKLIPFVILILVPGSHAFYGFHSIRRSKHQSDGISPGPAPVSGVGSPEATPMPELLGTITNEGCENSLRLCLQERLVACLVLSHNVPKELFLIVQNQGGNPMKVNVTVSGVKITLPLLQIHEHQAKKFNISSVIEGSPFIVLDGGDGNCVLHTESTGSGGVYWLPAYSISLNPINGAYILVVAILFIGGTWACCKLGFKGRQGEGVRYQELEMGLPDSCLAKNVETAEGWDQGWDDEWGEMNGGKSPEGHQTGNVSANGLTSRFSNKNGSGNDWND